MSATGGGRDDRGGRGRPDSRLDAARRRADLHRLAEEPFDVLVVGGGVTGAGTALDAATRGLRVALVERADLANGTSRWSSKLVHGGLRYLAGGDVALAWESARERHLLMERVAPHLTRPLGFLVPLTDDVPPAQAALMRTGLRLADGLRRAAGTPGTTLPAPRHVPAPEALGLVPAMRSTGRRGALLHWDGGLEDDARLVVALARTAALHGAAVVTRAAVHAAGGGRAVVEDVLTGERVEVRARVVVNATGVWATGLAPGLELRPSRGTHVVLPASVLGHPRAGVNVPVPGERNRFVFAVPHDDGTVHVGLTDDPVDEVTDEPRPGPGDVERLLEVLGRVLTDPPTVADVLGAYAGLRPLVLAGRAGGAAAGGGSSADLSRRHLVRTVDGLVTVVGGKLTTYRRMAEDAVDAAVRAGGLDAGPCVTASTGLVGAVPRTLLPAVRAPRRLVRRYGAEAVTVAALADRDPALLEPVVDGSPVLAVELLFGVLAEGALTVEDLLARRTRLSLVPRDADAARDAASELLARG
ncbi:glycerol-3-phosphate dehydrogenase/oxidase [Thalassiella azotivora]